jgi:hypothetical protein
MAVIVGVREDVIDGLTFVGLGDGVDCPFEAIGYMHPVRRIARTSE